MIGCNVATSCSEALGEGAHHDINIGRVYPPVLTHSPASGSHGSNTVGLVQVHIRLKESVVEKCPTYTNWSGDYVDTHSLLYTYTTSPLTSN